MKRPPGKRHRSGQAAGQPGISLVEILVSMAIVSIIAVSLASLTTLGLRMSNQARFDDQRFYPVRNAFDMIMKDLRLAQGVYPTCGTALIPGDPAPKGIAVHGPGENDIWIATYQRDTNNRLVRTVYTDAGCTVEKTSARIVLGQRITGFSISNSGAVFTVEMRARSSDAANTEFVLTQVAIGRMLGQP